MFWLAQLHKWQTGEGDSDSKLDHSDCDHILYAGIFLSGVFISCFWQKWEESLEFSLLNAQYVGVF